LAPETIAVVDVCKAAEGSVARKGRAVDKERTRSLAAPLIEAGVALECTSLRDAGPVVAYLEGSESMNRAAGLELLVTTPTCELFVFVGAAEDRPPFRNHDRTDEKLPDRSRPWLAFRGEKSLEVDILVCNICRNAC
jgi:hypothetical protein